MTDQGAGMLILYDSSENQHENASQWGASFKFFFSLQSCFSYDATSIETSPSNIESQFHIQGIQQVSNYGQQTDASSHQPLPWLGGMACPKFMLIPHFHPNTIYIYFCPFLTTYLPN